MDKSRIILSTIVIFLGLLCCQVLSTTTNGGRVTMDNLDIESIQGSLVNISWTTNSSNINNSNFDKVTKISGFVLSYQLIDDDKDDDVKSVMKTTKKSDKYLEFKSPKLSPDTRSATIPLPSFRNITICVQAMYGKIGSSTDSSYKMCVTDLSTLKNSDDENKAGEKEDDESEKSDSKKLIVGISAGGLFLIPCVIVLIFIMRKDKKMRKSMYEKLGHEHLNNGLDLGDENEKKSCRCGGKTGHKDGEKKGGSGGGVTDLQSLSVAQLEGVKVEGPKIYVHTGGDDSDSEIYSNGRDCPVEDFSQTRL